ncbi:MAG: GAF domain-containing protein [Chloroflexi bacterium]|nr:GAF domain-containing protein [Chloroflexota bacterium]
MRRPQIRRAATPRLAETWTELAQQPLLVWLVAAAIALLLVGELLQLLLGRVLGPWRDLWVTTAALVAAVAAVHAALSSRQPLASPWWWFAAAAIFWAFGALVRALQGAPARTAASPVLLPDLGFLGCAVLCLVGFASAAPGGSSTLPRLRLVIDAVLLPSAFGLLAYLLIPHIGPWRETVSTVRDLHVLLWVASWALYMAVLFAALLACRRLGTSGRWPEALEPHRTLGSALVWAAVVWTPSAFVLGLSSLWPQAGLPRVLADVGFLSGFALLTLQAAEALRPLPPVSEPAAPNGRADVAGRRGAAPVPLLPWWPSGNLPLVGTVAAAVVLLFATIAYLLWDDRRPAVFLGSLGLLGLLAGRLLITIRENERLIARQRVSGELEARLHEVGLALNRLEQFDKVLELICEAGQRVFQADTVILWRVDPRGTVLECVAAVGHPARNFPSERRTLRLDDEKALAVRVFVTGKSERLPHARPDHRTDAFLTRVTRAKSLLAVPLVSNNQRLGVLVFANAEDPEAFAPEDILKAELLAGQAVVAMENAKLYSDLARRLDEVQAFHELSQVTPYARTASDVACGLLEILRRRLDYVHAAVYLTEGVGRPLVPVAVAQDKGPIMAVESDRRPPPSVMSSLRTQLTDPTLRKVVASGEPARLEGEPRGDHQFLHAGMQVRLTVPMKLGDQVLGAVDLESNQPGAYQGPGMRVVLSLAYGAAQAIQNLRLFAEAREVDTLRELDRVKSELLQTVSHELRTPLGAIKGFTTTLMEHDSRLTREEKLEFLEIIDQESDRLRGLIEDLLDMSKIDAGVLQLDRQAVQMAKLVAEAVKAVASRSPEHRFEVAVPPDLFADADPRRIRQVVHNLLENAVKYSPDGGVIRVTGRRDDSGWLVMSVRDQGIGIPRQHLARVFDRFHRIDTDVGRKVGGSGLGLAICRGVVEAHGGRIWVESAGEGQGSEFSFTLPPAPSEPLALASRELAGE